MRIGKIELVLFVSVAVVALTLVLPCKILAGQVPDTGQTKCYDNSVEITCPNPGQPFYGQDAQYSINPQSYTKLDALGNALPYSATSWVMVRDNVTGLIWEVKQNRGGGADYENPHDADNLYFWYDSNSETNGGYPGTPGDGTDTEDFINALNSASFGGFSDWRLPTIKELASIVNTGTSDPAINTGYFPNTVPADYWSSTTYAGDTVLAWLVYFECGDVYPGHLPGKSSDMYFVRAVRGGQPEPPERFVDNGNGTVTDTPTGLMWQQATVGGMNWEAALSYCEGLILNNDGAWTNGVPNASGVKYSDWRLPNPNELQSLVDYSTYNRAIDTELFPDTVSSYYWSSTTFAYHTDYAWHVYFYDGEVYGDYKSSTYYVRAVRGPPVVVGRVPDTGQTESYTDTFGEDSDYMINPQSYTKLDALGNALPYSATSWIMVRDNVTGLIWEVKQDKDGLANYTNPHDADNRYSWYDSNEATNGGYAGTDGDGTDTEDFINDLNSANFGGFSDWRVPTIKELSSIVNSGTFDPAINTGYFPNTGSYIQYDIYWSSTTYAGGTIWSTKLAWHVYSRRGDVPGYFADSGFKGDSELVRAVRGGQPEPPDRFFDNLDGTVTDTSTGLMWQQATAVPVNWEEALSYSETLLLAGYDDWRLPNRNELQSLVDYSTYNPAIDTEFFLDTVWSSPWDSPYYYWSSTTSASRTGSAWRVLFYAGIVYGYGPKSGTSYVRAVRDVCECTDNDGDNYAIEGGDCGLIDCNDADATINPGATELCNGIDDNCDDQVDEDIYVFGGFQQPINQDGSSIFKLGRTIPVKIILTDCSGEPISTATVTIAVVKISDSIMGVEEEMEVESSGKADSGNLFRYDGSEGQYIFNLSTKSFTKGTYRTYTIPDKGESYSVMFSLK